MFIQVDPSGNGTFCFAWELEGQRLCCWEGWSLLSCKEETETQKIGGRESWNLLLWIQVLHDPHEGFFRLLQLKKLRWCIFQSSSVLRCFGSDLRSRATVTERLEWCWSGGELNVEETWRNMVRVWRVLELFFYVICCCFVDHLKHISCFGFALSKRPLSWSTSFPSVLPSSILHIWSICRAIFCLAEVERQKTSDLWILTDFAWNSQANCNLGERGVNPRNACSFNMFKRICTFSLCSTKAPDVLEDAGPQHANTLIILHWISNHAGTCKQRSWSYWPLLMHSIGTRMLLTWFGFYLHSIKTVQTLGCCNVFADQGWFLRLLASRRWHFCRERRPTWFKSAGVQSISVSDLATVSKSLDWVVRVPTYVSQKEGGLIDIMERCHGPGAFALPLVTAGSWQETRRFSQVLVL